MFGLDPLFLGIFLVTIAIMLYGLVRLLIRAVPKIQPVPPTTTLTAAVNALDLPENDDAIFVVTPGGKIAFANETLRDWLNFSAEVLPNLEHIARRSRPSETLLSLCASPSQARLSIQGLMVEGISYVFPYEGSQAILVSLRRPDLSALTDQDSNVSVRALDILTELSKSMTASLDLNDTLYAILESIERLIPSDMSEITLWDSSQNVLVPYGFAGLPDVDRRLEKSSLRYQPNEGYTGYLFQHGKPLLVPDVSTYRDVAPARERRNFPIRSYMGVPLKIGGESIGTVELGSLSRESFTEKDLDVISSLASQAAIALKNALTHQEEAQRIAELSGLARLAQAVGSLRGFRDLFSHLVESISPLAKAEILGFLIYSEQRNQLAAQAPFTGLPDQVIGIYSAAVEPGTPAEMALQSQETIIAHEGPENKALKDLGLDHMAQAAGIRETVLIPLTAGGRMLGYLQAANKIDRSPFNDDDIRLLSIIAGQAAPIIENAGLVQESRRRATQAEALRKVAALAGSAATLDEILTFSLREICNLLQAAAAAIFLIEEERHFLRIHLPSLIGRSLDGVEKLPGLSTDAPEFSHTVTKTLLPITYQESPEIEPTHDFYHRLTALLEVHSLIAVPIIIRDRGIGEIVVGSQELDFFTPAKMELVFTAAGQIAGAIERSFLYSQTDEGLRRRVEQLSGILRLSRELNASVNLEHLLNLVHNEAIYNRGADCGTILLFGPAEDEAVWSRPLFFAGDPPARQPTELELGVIQSGKSALIENFAQTEFDPPHGSVGTSLVVPISSRESVVGLIHLHARTPTRFDEESLEFAETLAVQAAIALENARQYQDQLQHIEHLTQGQETLAKLQETYQALVAEQSLQESLRSIAEGIRQATHFESVMISVYDRELEIFQGLGSAGTHAEATATQEAQVMPWSQVRSLLKPEFRHNHSYFIPDERHPVLPGDHRSTVRQADGDGNLNGNRWRPDDMLLIPLLIDNQKPIGLIRVDRPSNGMRPNPRTLEALEVFATQAMLTIQGYDQVHALNARLEDLQIEIERVQQATKTSQARLPFLLRKDLEQTVSIQQLSKRSKRIQAALEIIRAVNQQTGREQVLQILGEEIVTRMGMDAVLIAEPSPRGPVLTQSIGAVPADTNPGALVGQRNPLRQSLQTSTAIFVANLASPDILEWSRSPLLTSVGAASFFALPIEGQGENSPPTAGLLAIGQEALPEFTPEDRQIYLLIAHQVSIALQNLSLLEETRQRLREVDLLLDFSRQLRSLNPDEILATLVDSAVRVITSSNASLVAIWDQKQELLVPRFASGYQNTQKILQIAYRSGEALPGKVFAEGTPLRADEVDLAVDYNISPDNLLLYQEATAGYVPISSMVIPIQAGQVTLGILVLDNFRKPAAFTREDQNLISSLTQQTGLILENARLFQDAQTRATQLQALTDVATTITSNLQVDAVIASLLDQLAIVIPFENSTLWVRQGDFLKVRAAQGFDDDEERAGLTVAIDDSQLLNEMITTGQPINVPNVHEDPRFPALTEHPRLSWAGIPLINQGEVIGVIALEKQEPNFYTAEHIRVASTFAGQAAIALENARLFEESVQRTQQLDQRTQRLDLLNRLSTEFSASLDMDHILHFTISQVSGAVPVSSVSAVLVDDDDNLQLHAELPRREEILPVRLPQAPLFDHLRESLGAFITEDVRQEPRLKSWADFFASRETQVLAIFPMASGSLLHGFLICHGVGERFSTSEIDLMETISNQVSVALENARLFKQTQTALAETEQQARRLMLLNELSTQVNHAENVDEILNATADYACRIFQADRVSIAIQDPDSGDFHVLALHDEEGLAPVEAVDPLEANAIPTVLSDNRSILLAEAGKAGTSGLQSLISVPLPTRDVVFGSINLGSEDPQAYSPNELNILIQVASLVSATIDNKNLLDQTRRLTADLEQRVAERTAALAHEHQRSATLLGLITELSASLDIETVLNRTLSRIIEIVGAEQGTILLTRNEETRESMPTLYRRASLGYTDPPPAGGDPTGLAMNEGLAGWVITNRKPALIPDLRQDERWISPRSVRSEHRSSIAVPIMLGDEALGVLLLFHRQPDQFDDSQLELINATARQIAVAINNAQLYHLIRDQAERLGGMLRTQQIEASRLLAILEAVADGVLVTDPQNRIFVFNASAEVILGLESESILGDSLENFSGFFGKAGSHWINTIRRWSEDPASLQEDATHSEQLDLEDGRVVAVNLAPVILNSEFLGTVSIFRDITHEIEVDRLKSEFVATVSHELRTPMTSIRGYVDILLMGAAGKINEQQMNFLQVVQSNTVRLNILVNDLLEVSRIEAGKVQLSVQAVDMVEIINQMVEEFSARAQEVNKDLHFEVSLGSGPTRVLGDQERILQIVENVISNAYHYTPNGGQIEVRIRPADDFMQVDVKDSGIGIDPEDQERIFERFYRGEDPLVLATAGTGLGLSIVKYFVELHGGRIWVESEGIAGRGTTFSFTLPTYHLASE